jgi:hypothetical protein
LPQCGYPSHFGSLHSISSQIVSKRKAKFGPTFEETARVALG